MILAPGTKALEASVTIPTILPVAMVVWANAADNSTPSVASIKPAPTADLREKFRFGIFHLSFETFMNVLLSFEERIDFKKQDFKNR
jgi:hypothetical protein